MNSILKTLTVKWCLTRFTGVVQPETVLNALKVTQLIRSDIRQDLVAKH